jgi:GNAT superfamily N-acetyltransferase
MIRERNANGHWRSCVASLDGLIVGHALLSIDPSEPGLAELAMNVVHPCARGLGIATRLCEHLCAFARRSGLSTLTMKQVSTHPHSQRLARILGFRTTGLLLDYVASPFGLTGRESVVLGCLPLRSRPLPGVAFLGNGELWLAMLAEAFGTVAVTSAPAGAAPMRISSHGKRIEVALDHVDAGVLDELVRLPRSRLVYVRLPIDQSLRESAPRLRHAGYAPAGIVPAPQGQWHWLMQRGFEERELSLHCPIARCIHDEMLRGSLTR